MGELASAQAVTASITAAIAHTVARCDSAYPKKPSSRNVGFLAVTEAIILTCLGPGRTGSGARSDRFKSFAFEYGDTRILRKSGVHETEAALEEDGAAIVTD